MSLRVIPRPEKTHYALASSAAGELKGIIEQPFEVRKELLRRYARERGTEALLDLFAQFIGIVRDSAMPNVGEGKEVAENRQSMRPERGLSLRTSTTLLLITFVALSVPAQPPGVFTRSYDNARTGWNPHETTLTQSAVIQHGLVRQTTIPVIGDARGMEAQPLILPAVKMKDGSTHDVMVLPSMANVVRGVDAESGAGLWQVTLAPPVKGSAKIDFHGINDRWGCLPTGVIDPDTKRWYGVCWTSPDASGAAETARWYLYGLHLSDGEKAFNPVLIAGEDGTNDFNATMRKLRSSAVLIAPGGKKTLVECGGTVLETGAGSSGFCFAVDLTGGSPRITAMLATTHGAGAGIWMAGQGLVADAQNNLYAVTGNGDFDGRTQFGESLIRLRYTPPASATAAGKLEIVDHWTPWTDFARAGRKPSETVTAGESMPGETLRELRNPMPVGSGMARPAAVSKIVANLNEQGDIVPIVYPAMATGAWSDEDWGSSGPACLFSIGVCVAAGKDGIAYPVRSSSMGNTTPADLASPKANCAKLVSPPVWLTMSPGPVDPCPADPATLNFFPWGDTAHLHMTPVQLYDPLLKRWTIFAWGENAQLHKWAIDAAGKLTYVAQGHEYASVDVRGNPPGGMPGGFCSGSSNGADPDSMLLVCSIPYNDANARISQGRLLVYDPVHLATDGSLKVLWDSQRWGVPYVFNKFMPPVIWNGRVYLPNYNGGVEVFSLGK